MGRRIHLAAPGGGAACGAHNGNGLRAYESTVLASPLVALVDCRKCRYTTQYKDILDPPRQYRLRLFAMVTNTDPPRRLSPAEISADMAYHRVEVLLDGEPVAGLVAYDAEQGWVERHQLHKWGRPIISGDKFATERVAGVVEVRWRRAA